MDNVFTKSTKASLYVIAILAIAFSASFNFSILSKIGYPFANSFSINDLFFPAIALSIATGALLGVSFLIIDFIELDHRNSLFLRFYLRIVSSNLAPFIGISFILYLFVLDYGQETNYRHKFDLIICIIMFLIFIAGLSIKFRSEDEIDTKLFFFCIALTDYIGNTSGALYFHRDIGFSCDVLLRKGEFVGLRVFRYDEKRLIGFMSDRTIIVPADQIEQVRCGPFKKT